LLQTERKKVRKIKGNEAGESNSKTLPRANPAEGKRGNRLHPLKEGVDDSVFKSRKRNLYGRCAKKTEPKGWTYTVENPAGRKKNSPSRTMT